MYESLILFGLAMTALCIVLARSFLHHGNYRRSPVGRDDEEWFETPEWLKCLLLGLYGFAVASLAVVLAHFLLSYRPPPPTWWASGPISLLVTVLFFLISNAGSNTNRRNKRISLVIAFVLGTLLAIFLYGSISVK